MKFKKLQKLFFPLFFLMLCGSYSVYAENLRGLDAREVIKRIIKPNANLSFKGTEIHILIGKDGVPTIRKYSVGRKDGEFARTEVDRKVQSQEVYIENSYGTWIYYPEKDIVIKKPALPRENKLSIWEKDKFNLIQANYDITFIRNNNIANRACAVYSFRPKEKGRLIREFWIDILSGFPLRIDTFEPNGRLLNISSFEAIEFDPKFSKDFYRARKNKPPALDVVFVPYQRIKEEVGHNVRFPGYVPKGYWLSNIFVQKKKHGERYQMIYSDGMVPLSIFQEKRDENPSTGSIGNEKFVSFGGDGRGYFKQKGIVKVFSFIAGNSKNTIVGEVGKNEMVKIAESLYSTKGGIKK